MARLMAMLAIAVITVGAPAQANPGGASAMRAAVQAFMREQHLPGGTVAVSVGGRTIWSQGFGIADVEDGARATSETMYRTASMGKPMTATIAFMLREQGELDFSAPVQRYCPRYPTKPWPVTVQELVSHSSGIREPRRRSRTLQYAPL